MRLVTGAVVSSLIACQPTRWGAAPRSAVTMQMDFMKNAMGGLKMPGMPGGDDMGLSKEQAEEMEARMKTGGMSFDDFLMQVKVMQKAGSMQAMMQKMPFGGGGHKCIGLHFADMLFKCLMINALREYRVEYVDPRQANGKILYIPFTRPKDNLPLRFIRWPASA